MRKIKPAMIVVWGLIGLVLGGLRGAVIALVLYLIINFIVLPLMEYIFPRNQRWKG
jgi:hypothetical protein